MRPEARSLGLLVALLAAPGGAAEVDSHTWGGLEARSIGPAAMSGRVAAVDAVPLDTLVIYVGAASGGVWKSVDGGLTFKPIFDDHVQSIGAIEIDPNDPRTVWVGTGESWTRNSVSVGDGVYKTTDGGESWERMGLADSERIAAIVVDPRDSDTVYVCATGRLWSSGGERGVYKTTDGGKTWAQVLGVDENTGCSDLAMDPQEPDILYAGMWQFRRWPWFFYSGGPGSGLYKTTDGGKTWKRLERGLPAGELGRIAVAVAPSRPSVVYASVEAKDGGFYRSDDLGETWVQTDRSFAVRARPFYFSMIRVDPREHRTVYKGGFDLLVSTDGGESFASAGGGTHPDHHALWIHPQNPRHLILGTDGGLYISEDAGHHWRFVRSLPISQFYHVSYDMEFPYNVYGGLQDNGSWMGPSRAPGGVRNKHWRNVGFGDGFYTFRDPLDADFVYSEYQGGQLRRLRLSTGEMKDIRPYEGKEDPKFRFNWNTPVHLSPTVRGRIYVGAQFLFRSEDRGDSWARISPDLTTNDPAKQRQEESGGLTLDNSTAENHCTIYAIAESPLDPDVVWVGTDDGNLQVTRDGGASWTNVVGHVPGLPPNTWVSSVEASHHDPGTAYVTFDGHGTGDMKTYVYRTTDFGASWISLATEEMEGYAHVVREDLEDPQLLFVGTEFGLYVSIDGGQRWARFQSGLPRKAPVRALAIHPRAGDLIIGTHGRGIYILDDLTPLRALEAEHLEADIVLLPSRPAVMILEASVQDFGGEDEFVGANPPEAAWITYFMKRRHVFGELKVRVYDAEGRLIKELPGGKRRGINRVAWPMRLKPPKVPPASALVPAFQGPRVPEGRYRVEIVKGEQKVAGEVELVADPRSPHSAEDRALQQRTALRLYGLLERLTWVVESLEALRDGARERAEAVGQASKLGGRLQAYADELEAFRGTLVATREGGGLAGEEKLREKLGGLYGNVVSYGGRPSSSQLERVQVLEAELERAVEQFDRLRGTKLAELNEALHKARQPALAADDYESWKRKQED